jgi:hypothetical protein
MHQPMKMAAAKAALTKPQGLSKPVSTKGIQ